MVKIMNNLDVSQMEEIAGGNKATAIIGCAASVVALEAALIGLDHQRSHISVLFYTP